MCLPDGGLADGKNRSNNELQEVSRSHSTKGKNLERLKEHREELLESIRDGKYKPSSVCRVEIPKDNGGVRKLGIPTVIDRIIQQAIAEVLMPIYEPKFSDGSYGYRPHRSAKDAILKVKNGQMKATNMQHVLIFWKQWKLPRTRVERLTEYGMPKWKAYRNDS